MDSNTKWTQCTLGQLTENMDSIRIPVKESERHSGAYPYYGASGIVDYVDKFLFDGEYLLIAEDGENLRTRNTPIAFLACGRFWVNNHAHIVRGNNRANTRFLMYALANTDISGYLTGSTMPKLTQANMNRIPISTPPLHEQQRIASTLGSIDGKIELNRQMNKTLEAISQTIFKHWFIDFEFPDEEGKPFTSSGGEMVDSELGEIPKGWKVGTIGDLAEVVGGSTPSTKDAAYWEKGIHHWATPKDLSKLTIPVLLDTERRITDAGLSQISSGLLPVGTVLLSSRAPIGYLAVAEVPLAINQGFIAMKPRKGVPNLFLLRWAAFAHEEIVSRANGSTFLEISKTNFRPIQLVVPPNAVLYAFDSLVRPFYERMVSSERESSATGAIRDALLPKLISGKIRVK
jgi:type I restriction enzyme, S subunit